MANTKRLIELGMATELAKEVAAQIDAAASAPGAVSSVNGQTGEVELGAEDVGAVATPDTPAAYSTEGAAIAAVLVSAGLMEEDGG